MSAQGPVERLAREQGKQWPSIARSRAAARTRLEEIGTLLRDEGLIPSDCEFVAFGSLARLEVTQGSDVDWTLLVDGPADPHHKETALAIETALEAKDFKAPGRTGTFADLAFSHELIHRIGGPDDTNGNTTRRVLLLLESVGLSGNIGVRERVIRQLFRRYLDEDRGYHAIHQYKVRVPRLLLNDVVRYWRTMAVDYAAKRRERGWSGWAIRNVKLRTSRKLMFAAGLAMCLFCELKPSEALSKLADEHAPEEEFYGELSTFLRKFTDQPPLDIMARFGSSLGDETTAATCDLLDRYDQFLELLDDATKRKTLDNLNFEDAAKDDTYREAREIGTGFQAALTKLFFGSNPELTSLAQRYGVF